MAFSCKGRGLCPSCGSKRAAELAAFLVDEVVEGVGHAQWVFTIPKTLRVYFLHHRELLGELSRAAAETVKELLAAAAGEEEGLRPGIVSVVQTFGDRANFHPHVHALVSAGGFSPDGTFHPLEPWDGEAIMTLFRQALLERLVARHAISGELKSRLLGWRHPGFSTHVGEPIPPNDARAIEDMASYVVRNPVSLKRLVYIDGQQAVIYRALRSNPSIGANFVALDPLEWLARITDHIPDPGRHRTLFYAHYANRARGARAREKKLLEAPGAEESSTRRCSPSWARLISKVYHADPLTCRRCGASLQIVAYIHDQFTIKKILECLGLSPPEVERPPPDIHYVPVDDDGREMETMVAEGPHLP